MADLPGPAVRRIIQLARRRRIPGTNRFAAVCRAWNEASTGAVGEDQEEEQLQLSLHLDLLREAQLTSAFSWLQRHGGCVTGLRIQGMDTPRWPFMQQVLEAPTVHLTHLDVMGADTLLCLAPHLQQLPSLQHLGASIHHEKNGKTHTACWGAQERVENPPDMRLLCPQLTSLHLHVDTLRKCTFYIMGNEPPYAGLSTLLPLGLLQLRLTGKDMALDCNLVPHLTALDQLSLKVDAVSDLECLLGMTQLQRLVLEADSLWDLIWWEVDADLALFASKLVKCGSNHDLPFPAVTHLSQLTALSLKVTDSIDSWGEVNGLLSLTSLRHLSVQYIAQQDDEEDVDDVQWLLQCLDNLGSLRSLSLLYDCPPQCLVEVWWLTQLTALCLEGDPLEDDSVLDGLQALVGLRSLQVKQTWVAACSRQFVALQQLTRLVICEQQSVGVCTPFREMLAPLVGQCGSLKHVWCACRDESKGGPPPRDLVPSPLPGVQVTIAGLLPWPQDAMPPQHLPRLTPHLPGVFELVPHCV
jgi:hypothetical protein